MGVYLCWSEDLSVVLEGVMSKGPVGVRESQFPNFGVSERTERGSMRDRLIGNSDK